MKIRSPELETRFQYERGSDQTNDQFLQTLLDFYQTRKDRDIRL